MTTLQGRIRKLAAHVAVHKVVVADWAVAMRASRRRRLEAEGRTFVPVDNIEELRDALFHAVCLLDHANPENDTEHRDVAAARELSKLRETLNQATYRKYIVTPTGNGFYKVVDQATGKVASLKGLRQTNLGSRGRADEVARILNQQHSGKTKR